MKQPNSLSPPMSDRFPGRRNLRRKWLGTVRQKLLGVILLTTLVALVVALGAIVGYNLRVYHQTLVLDMTTQAELLGHMTAPALNFDDQQLASQNLSLLRIRPKVRAAAIYDAHGALFATYAISVETPQPQFPAVPEADIVRKKGPYLILFKSIVNDGETLGTVFLRADYELIGRIRDYLGIAAIATVLAMLIAFLLSMWLQRIVIGPIRAIAEITREVVEQRDYSRRAEKVSDDEIGALVDSFNDMLSEIERRTRDLEASNVEIAREVAERIRVQQEIMQLNSELEERVHDRTSQLEATNEALVSAKAAAEKANQAKSAFLSSMSHELRTPLNAILGFAQLLTDEQLPSTQEESKEFAEYILKAGRHLLVLINEVLDLAKVESGTLSLSREPVTLGGVLQECQEIILPLAAQRDIRVMFPSDDGPRVVADRTRLKQILLNLLSNAVKYNRDGGAIMISCTADTPDRMRIAVQDTGFGLDANQLKQLFQPFNRLGQESGSQEGTGIGLVVTKRLVEMMGGSIGATSTVGVGSIFWIELESAPPAPSHAALENHVSSFMTAPAAEPTDQAQRTLLYVEDNPANLKLVQVMIAFRRDLRLLSAADAQLGIDLAQIHQPDVILMDINLPGMSGIEALKKLRNNPDTAHIPVIALTANAMPQDIAKGMVRGFFRYLTKPINVHEFFAALDSALATTDQRSQRHNDNG